MRSSTTTAPKSVDNREGFDTPSTTGLPPSMGTRESHGHADLASSKLARALGRRNRPFARHIASKKNDASASGFLLAFTRSYSQDPGWFLFRRRRLLICL